MSANYDDYVGMHQVKQGWMNIDQDMVFVMLSRANSAENERISVLRGCDFNGKHICTSPQIDKCVKFRLPSPSHKYVAMFIERKDFFEIQVFLDCEMIACAKSKLFDRIYFKQPFGSPIWSPDEKYIVFTGEISKAPESHWDNPNIDVGANREHHETWGEQLEKSVSPKLFRLCLEDESIAELYSGDEYSLGQPTISNDGFVVACSWANTPRKSGIVYYNTRPSFLVCIPLAGGKLVEIIPGLIACNPKINNGVLFFFNTVENKIETHASTSVLMCVQFLNGDIIGDSTTFFVPEQLFINQPLATYPFCSDDVIIFSTQERSLQKIMFANSRNAQTSCLKPPIDNCSCFVLDVSNDLILVRVAALNMPSSVFIYRVSESKWSLVYESPKLPVQFFHSIIEFGQYEALYVSSNKPKALAVWLHGGPHSLLPNDYSIPISYLVCNGFDVLAVNYRGSSGYGLDLLNSLPGKVGKQDVEDVYRALMATIFSNSALQGIPLVVLGGSHGGFLTCHLIGQYPDLFKAAAARNPVCNILALAFLSDIPDWAFVETGFPVTPLLSEKHLNNMFSASPYIYIDSVKTPFIVGIGMADLRCPPGQGIDYARHLRRRCVPTRILTFPEANHSLDDSARTEIDWWESVLKWFNKYIE